MIIYAATNGYVDHLPESALKRYESELFRFIEHNDRGLQAVLEKKQLDDDVKQALNAALEEFKAEFTV